MGSGYSQDEAPQVPHNYEAIIKDADSPIDNSSTDKLYDQLQAGVFLNQKRKASFISSLTCIKLSKIKLSYSIHVLGSR